MYETYALEQTALASKQYRHLGIGGKLSELLARPKVSDHFKVRISSCSNFCQTYLAAHKFAN